MFLLQRPGNDQQLGWAAGLGLLLVAFGAWGQPAVVKVRAHAVTTHLTAYATVEPIAVVRLRAAETGLVAGLEVLPGQAVTAGAELARLQGPEVTARLTRRRGAVTSEQAALQAAQRTLAIERRQRASHLSTSQAVYEAQAALAQAQARLAAAREALQAAQANAVLRAPATGLVTSVAAASGERVEAGQTLLTVQPAGTLWLKADFYGADAGAVRTAMHGQFTPADGSPSVAVVVTSILPVVQADGGVAVGLRPATEAVHWLSGQAGTVALQATRRNAVTVPSEALILDQGQWWVLLHTAQGNERRRVVPGARVGNETVIERGLKAGAEVVVANAYLMFHRNVSQRYQPPD